VACPRSQAICNLVLRPHHTAEHQSAAAHVAPPCKFLGKYEPVAKNGKQRFHILRRCNATQENDLTVTAQMRGHQAGVALKGNTINAVPNASTGAEEIRQSCSRFIGVSGGREPRHA